MSYILILIIQLYWKLYPSSTRRKCLFEESCSKYVYRVTKENGFSKGISALIDRMHKCRPGYQLYKNLGDNSFELHLKNGSIIENENISKNLLPPISYNYKTKSHATERILSCGKTNK